MADNCLTAACSHKTSEDALVIGPCGVFTFDPKTGDLIPPDIDLIGEYGEPGKLFWYEDAKSITITPNRTITNTRCLRCKNLCETDIDSQALSIELRRCPDNAFHCDISSIDSTCQFSFMWFRKPANCMLPNPASDPFYYGEAVGGASDVGGSAADTEGETMTIDAQNCGELFHGKGFCNEEATSPLITSGLEEIVKPVVQDCLAAEAAAASTAKNP